MNQVWRRRIIGMLLSTLFSCFLINVALWVFDPLGVLLYFDAIQDHAAVKIAHPTGFAYPPNDYIFGAYPARIRRDGYRDVPLSVYADCVLTFVGDSFTYGSGVSDWETFASQIAAQFDDVEFHNAARGGYNVDNVSATMQHVRDGSNGIIYLIYDNDYYGGVTTLTPTTRRYLLPLGWYLYALGFNMPPPYDAQAFTPRLQSALSDDVLPFVFEDATIAMVAQDMGAIPIARPTSVISRYDFHPDAIGHQQIADSMLLHIESFASERCT
jgi:hypothetical protein